MQIMKLKKRYLFPFFYLVLLSVSIVAPVLFPVFFFLTIPSMIVVNSLSEALGGPVDTTYYVFLGGIVQFFLLGYLWDWLAQKINEPFETSV